jgi:hypothetical protein
MRFTLGIYYIIKITNNQRSRLARNNQSKTTTKINFSRLTGINLNMRVVSFSPTSAKKVCAYTKSISPTSYRVSYDEKQPDGCTYISEQQLCFLERLLRSITVTATTIYQEARTSV